MKTAPQRPAKASPYEGLGADALLAILAEKDADHERRIQDHERAIQHRDSDRVIRERDTRIIGACTPNAWRYMRGVICVTLYARHITL